jgi:hypothetical protein
MKGGILSKILADHATRPIDPNPPWGYEPSEAVKILKLRLEKSQAPESITLAEAAKQMARTDPAFLELAKSFGVTDEDLQPPPEPELGPQTRRHIEHLERQLAMEQMRVKELRAQMDGLTKKVGEAAVQVVLLERRAGEVGNENLATWVELELFPRLRGLLGMTVMALLMLSAMPLHAGSERERTRERSRETTDRSHSRESRESNEWSGEWGGGGTVPQTVPEPGSAAGLLVVAGAALVLRRRMGRRGR